jgi:hypothetical protein
VKLGDCVSSVAGNTKIAPSISEITPVPPAGKGLDGTEVLGSGKSVMP